MKGKLCTPGQLKAIRTLLSKLGMEEEDKESIVQAFTAGRTNHISNMFFAEAAALVGHLKSMDGESASADRMRNKILSYAHEMNWHLPPSPSPKERGVPKIDMDHVNNWCCEYGYLHKKLDAYTYKELPALVTQFEQVYKSYLKGK